MIRSSIASDVPFDLGTIGTRTILTGAITLVSFTYLLLTASLSPANATDFDCCADLEDRIAELEETTARKGNRKVSLTIAGQVNHALLFWDDGSERNSYVVGDKNDQSNFSFTGDAQITPDVRTGFVITLRLRDTLSDAVDQVQDDGVLGFTLWEIFSYVESKRLGRFSLGQLSRVSDTAPENDLSKTAVAGYVGVEDMGGAFFLRLNTGTLSSITLRDVYNHFNGDTANVVRYDTPALAGVVLATSYGEDDIWDVGAKYDGTLGDLQINGSIAYSQSTDSNGLDGSGASDNQTVVGSIAVLHKPSGLNALIAAGNRSFDNLVIDGDGVLRTPKDANYVYGKIGCIAQLTALGPTAFYGEYGHFHNYISASDTFTPVDIGADGVRFTGNNAQVWGAGVVQHIEAAEMQLYIGYRHHDFDFDVVNAAGNSVTTPGVKNFQSIVVGSKITF